MEINIPEALPRCELINVLAEKVSQRHDTQFNFFGKLVDFHDRVSGETRQINELFPEYTPHDDQYHLSRLFHVADTILERERLEEMNSAELFILAIALYGHDWGMAISNDEKDYILTDEIPEGRQKEDLWILPNEGECFAKFAKEYQIGKKMSGNFKNISIDDWREYVRQTHASRSAERVRRYFESIDGGVADAASRICEGHWLDFEELQDHHMYPSDFSALYETVNLRALAVYLRLIDLFDLAEDRTPYVIWKFVAPRDPRSKMAWEKHRALRPITCPIYQEGRIIKVDGSTDDHEVYAALEDFRIYCEEQLRGCNDLLARMNDPRHKLDLYHIDWRVAARGFEPISIQFEFNREKMFEILSDEIYQGDSYVFLRELLQNSIDAIRMRREILKRNRIDPGNVGTIQVNVEHKDNGDAIVTWIDDGIGMDEYVVRNYLAVAGKSYYASPEFEREGLKMDPISRFGVGILSCFMVADRIEIDAFKDPYLPPEGEPLKIIIPSVGRQFRIESRPREAAKVGTTVRVFVEGKKLSTDEGEPIKTLDVTGYLSIIAGFVEFPIVITEGERKIIILHPRQDPEIAKQHYGEQFEIHSIDLSFPLQAAVFPQDLSTAREFLREECVDFSLNLGLSNIQGTLTFQIPAEEIIDFHEAGAEYEILIRGQDPNMGKCIRFNRTWFYAEEASEEVFGLSRSSKMNSKYAVFRDGIIIPNARSPYAFQNYGDLNPKLIVNLPKIKDQRIDLSRTQFLGKSTNWDSPIYGAYLHYIYEKWHKRLLELDPKERLYQMGRLIAFYHIEREDLWKLFPHEHWPLLFLKPGGQLSVLEWKEIEGKTIYLSPYPIGQIKKELGNMIKCFWLTQREYGGFLTQWEGEQCLVREANVSKSIDKAIFLSRYALSEYYQLSAIRFLESPWDESVPLLQRIMIPSEMPEVKLKAEEILKKIIEDPSELGHIRKRILYELRYEERFYDIFKFIEDTTNFTQPFDEYFRINLSYDDRYYNLRHPLTQALLKCWCTLKLAERNRTLPNDQIGLLDDALSSVFHSIGDYRNLSEELSELRKINSRIQLYDIGEIENLIPDSEKLYVPGSVPSHYLTKSESFLENRPFGRPL